MILNITTMKKYILAPITLMMIFLFNSCQQNEIFLTGSVEGSDSTIVAISDFIISDTPDTIVVKDGKFSHKINIEHPGYYYFIYGEEVKMIFLAPGYDLNIAIQATDSTTNYTFLGKGDLENNTLQKINKELDKLSFNQIESIPFNSRNKYIDSLFNAFKNNFSDSVKHKKIDPIFVNFQKKYFDYNSAMLKTYFGLQSENKDPSYFKFVDDLDLNNGQCLGIPVFRWFLDYHTEYLLEESLLKMDSIKRDQEETRMIAKFEVIKNYENKIIKEYLMFSSLKQIIEYEGVEGFKKVKVYYDDFVKQDKYRDYIQIILNKKLLISKGKPAFNFTGIDKNGKEVQLKELNGKIVYLDFWATWCKPCKAEAPFNTLLSNEFKGKGIQFVSISIDDEKNLEEWKNFIKEDKNILHLRITKDKVKELTDAFQIKGIPTYMLIDQNGNFINSAAPRPSSSEIRQILNQLTQK